jgi:hypothetical protein
MPDVEVESLMSNHFPDTLDAAALKPALAHVQWLGGATDSGKTTAAQRLAETMEEHFTLVDGTRNLPGQN